MRNISEKNISKIKSCKLGITLIEILIALIILVVTVLPVISVFSKYYGVSSKQLSQEVALKITEAAMNELLSARFSSLDGGSLSIPLNLETSAGRFSGTFNFSGHKGSSNKIKLGVTTYQLVASTTKIFEAQDPLGAPNPKALVFRYLTDTGGPSPTIATYACTDDMISIEMGIKYGKFNKKLDIVTFRADMSK